ncbi:NADH-quinone oxidoreductase subunit A [Thiotrichales bacterium 19S11-10]|nr:NADH-quinone oxidoreductase subunit A [Thiotrichales bacterium 19S11-10]MCF6806966.1 NADH-quinone oxidoreductase subunit A [Thiotrichales bacterium 19S9-11]MCF6810935.1 NADH-quinone oxidoreductase subunit A [Thiotrichales bacterium 19S9-12]
MLYENYLPILVFLVLSCLIGVGAAVAGKLVSKFVGAYKPDDEKNSPFECGFPEFEDARMKFDVRYYLVAILFLIFDLEIAFLFPWSAVLSDLSLIAFLSMMVFLLVLLIGFVYEWKKGALEWE